MDFQGSVQLQRKQPLGWASPQPVRRRGLPLLSQDRLEVKRGAEALVRCASPGRKLWTVEPGGPFPVTRGCGQETTLRQALRPEALAGGGDPHLPYLITPRATSVIGMPLALRWNPVAGVRVYQVWLLRQRDHQLLWGSRVENASAIALPKSVALTAGERYLLVVEADNGSSSVLDSPADDQAFRLATTAELASLERQRTRLPLARLDPEAAALLQADGLSQYDLLDDAITTLEHYHARHGPTVGVLLELGRLYGRIGVNSLAVERFEQAGSLARSGDVPDALAEARAEASAAGQRRGGGGRKP
ncbi:MAG: hypothetical protein WAM11_03010 [Cyanobium sp.]